MRAANFTLVIERETRLIHPEQYALLQGRVVVVAGEVEDGCGQVVEQLARRNICFGVWVVGDVATMQEEIWCERQIAQRGEQGACPFEWRMRRRWAVVIHIVTDMRIADLREAQQDVVLGHDVRELPIACSNGKIVPQHPDGSILPTVCWRGG